MATTTLLSPQRSDPFAHHHVSVAEQDGEGESADVLPSLPSSSSSLFLAHAQRTGPSTPMSSRRRRVTSLYGDASIAASDAISIEGSSTYEYDITSNIRNQQSRRRRGDSNASISTVVSVLSRNLSIADSISPSVQAYERDGHVRGQFTTGGADNASVYSAAYGHESPNEGSAAASLRRIRKSSEAGRRRAMPASAFAAAAEINGMSASGSRAHLTDKLEQLIANSASYRAVAGKPARVRAEAAGIGAGPEGGDGGGTFAHRDRKSSFASLRSLIAFTSSNTPQQRQTSTGEYYMPSSGRAASMFGVNIGGGGGRGGSNASKGVPASLRSPSWSKPSVSSASTLTTTSSGTFSAAAAAAAAAKGPLSSSAATTSSSSTTNLARQPDAIGSLRGIHSLFPSEYDPRMPPSSKRVRPKLAVRSQTGPLQESRKSNGRVSPAAETEDGSSPTTENGQQERQRHVSFHDSLRHRATPGIAATATGTNLSTITSGRRAFAAMDPTSSVTHSAANSGSATPRTVRSISPPLSSSRGSSRLDLTKDAPSDAAAGSADRTPSVQSDGSGNGAMPALDAALARAEDRSGLKTSSRCTTCNKKVVNAPVSKSGDVFCGRDCRMEAKRKRLADAQQAAAAKTPSSGVAAAQTGQSAQQATDQSSANTVASADIPRSSNSLVPTTPVASQAMLKPSIAAPV